MNNFLGESMCETKLLHNPCRTGFNNNSFQEGGVLQKDYMLSGVCERKATDFLMINNLIKKILSRSLKAFFKFLSFENLMKDKKKLSIHLDFAHENIWEISVVACNVNHKQIYLHSFQYSSVDQSHTRNLPCIFSLLYFKYRIIVDADCEGQSAVDKK